LIKSGVKVSFPYVVADPEVSEVQLQPGVDRFLIMGSDGLWDVFTSEQAVEIVAHVMRENRIDDTSQM